MNTKRPLPVRIIDRIITDLLIAAAIVIMAFGGISLWDIYRQYERSSSASIHMKAGAGDTGFDGLLAIAPDTAAWIALDGTRIDQPVMSAGDNSYYLEHDIYGRHYIGGCIFIDCRCSPDCSDFYTLIHGHHMDMGAMFGDLEKYSDDTFFETHDSGTLYTPERCQDLEIFAYMCADAYDDRIYAPDITADPDPEGFLKYLRDHADLYRDIGVGSNDRIAAFSTCSSAFTDGRHVVFARITDRGLNGEKTVKKRGTIKTQTER